MCLLFAVLLARVFHANATVMFVYTHWHNEIKFFYANPHKEDVTSASDAYTLTQSHAQCAGCWNKSRKWNKTKRWSLEVPPRPNHKNHENERNQKSKCQWQTKIGHELMNSRTHFEMREKVSYNRKRLGLKRLRPRTRPTNFGESTRNSYQLCDHQKLRTVFRSCHIHVGCWLDRE